MDVRGFTLPQFMDTVNPNEADDSLGRVVLKRKFHEATIITSLDDLCRTDAPGDGPAFLTFDRQSETFHKGGGPPPAWVAGIARPAIAAPPATALACSSD